MQIRISLYAVPRSFHAMTKEERNAFNTFLDKAIEEQLAISPSNDAISRFLPFTGPVKVSIQWFMNTIATDQMIESLNWGDIDNVAKPLLDALQNRVIKNDRQVIELNVFKRSLKEFDLSNKPVVEMTYATFAANKAVDNKTDFVFIEVSDVVLHF